MQRRTGQHILQILTTGRRNNQTNRTSPSTATGKVTLLAFVADRLAAVRRPCRNRSISPVFRARVSKPAAVVDSWDRQTDGHRTVT